MMPSRPPSAAPGPGYVRRHGGSYIPVSPYTRPATAPVERAKFVAPSTYYHYTATTRPAYMSPPRTQPMDTSREPGRGTRKTQIFGSGVVGSWTHPAVKGQAAWDPWTRTLSKSCIQRPGCGMNTAEETSLDDLTAKRWLSRT